MFVLPWRANVARALANFIPIYKMHGSGVFLKTKLEMNEVHTLRVMFCCFVVLIKALPAIRGPRDPQP